MTPECAMAVTKRDITDMVVEEWTCSLKAFRVDLNPKP